MRRAIPMVVLVLAIAAVIAHAGDKPRCVCEPSTKKVSHVVYDCRCEHYCAAHCGCLHKLLAWFGCGCDCACECGTVRTRHVLLKKTVTEECPTVRCVVPPEVCPGAAVPR